jgi:Cysteine-rich CPCC
MTKFPCPCCLNLVYEEPCSGDYSICPHCGWEDDPVQFADVEFEGGANEMSLKNAQIEWKKTGKRTIV